MGYSIDFFSWVYIIDEIFCPVPSQIFVQPEKTLDKVFRLVAFQGQERRGNLGPVIVRTHRDDNLRFVQFFKYVGDYTPLP